MKEALESFRDFFSDHSTEGQLRRHRMISKIRGPVLIIAVGIDALNVGVNAIAENPGHILVLSAALGITAFLDGHAAKSTTQIIRQLESKLRREKYLY